MKTTFHYSILLKALFTICCWFSLTAISTQAQAQCINPSQIDTSRACTQVFDPVCGCDGVTYPNVCYATYYAGVTSYTLNNCANATCYAGFTSSTNGVLVTFSNTTNTYGNFHWDFGDGNTSTDTHPIHLYQQPGYYEVCLTVTNSFCTSTYCDTVFGGGGSTACTDGSIVDTTYPCVAVYDPVCGCNGITYANDCEATFYGGQVTWTQGPCQNAGGCHASFQYNVQLGIAGWTVSFNNTSTGNYTHVYWDFGDGHTSTQISPNHTYLVSQGLPSQVTVCLTVTDTTATQCFSQTCMVINLSNSSCIDQHLIDLNAACYTLYSPVCGCDGVTYGNACEAEKWHGVTSYTNGPCGGSGCQANFLFDIAATGSGSVVSFYDTSVGSPTSWHWNFGDGTGSTQQNPSHTYTTPGTYTVCLAIASNNSVNCRDTICKQVIIPHAACVDSSLIDTTHGCFTIFDPVCGCDGNTYSNSCVATYHQGVTTYTAGPCNNGSCHAFFTYDHTQTTPNGYIVQFTDSSLGSASTRLWDFGDGNTSTQQNPVHGYLAPGYYTVCLTISDNQNCHSQYCQTVHVSNTTTCYNPAQIDSSTVCPLSFAPVCGCDGVTYAGPCEAEYYGGVTRYTVGPCGGSTCQAGFSYTRQNTSVGFTLLFNNTSSGGFTNVHWDFGDGSSSTALNPTHTYTQPGTYQICLTVYDSAQTCYAHTCQTVTLSSNNVCYDPHVIDQNTACPTVITPVCGCDGVTYNNACEAYYWHGITQYTHGACGSFQQCRASFSYNIQIGFAGYTVFFQNTSTGSFTDVVWDFGNGDTSHSLNPSYTYFASNLPDTFEVCLTIYDSAQNCYDKTCKRIALGYPNSGCIDSSMINHNVPCPLFFQPVCGCDGVTYGNSCEAQNYGGVTSWTQGPCTTAGCQAFFTYTITPTAIGYEVSFTDQSSGNPSSWSWSFGDGSGSTHQNPSHTYLVPDSMYVCLTIGSNSTPNCQDSYCTWIRFVADCIDSSLIDTNVGCPGVIAPVCGCDGVTYQNSCIAMMYHGVKRWTNGQCGQTCQAQFTVSLDPLTGEATFTNQSVGNYSEVYWDFGDGHTDTVVKPTHTFSNTLPRQYNVCLTIFNPFTNCYDKTCMSVLYGGTTCIAGFTWQQDSTGLTVYFSNLSTGPIKTSHWDFGDGHTDTLINPVHTYLGSGRYEVCLTVGNNTQGCTVTFCDTINVAKTTSIGEVNGLVDEFMVYPNPFSYSTNITYTLSEASNVRIEVFDLLGKRIGILKEDADPAGTHQLNWNTGPVEAGVYLLRIQTDKGAVTRRMHVIR